MPNVFGLVTELIVIVTGCPPQLEPNPGTQSFMDVSTRLQHTYDIFCCAILSC